MKCPECGAAVRHEAQVEVFVHLTEDFGAGEVTEAGAKLRDISTGQYWTGCTKCDWEMGIHETHPEEFYTEFDEEVQEEGVTLTNEHLDLLVEGFKKHF